MDTKIACRTATATTGYEHPIGPQDGLKSINASPGDQMRLLIENEIAPCGVKMDADHFANYMAGFQGGAYDAYFYPDGLVVPTGQAGFEHRQSKQGRR